MYEKDLDCRAQKKNNNSNSNDNNTHKKKITDGQTNELISI